MASMRTTHLSLGLLAALFSVGCHSHHDAALLVPVAPVSTAGAEPTPELVQPKPAPVQADPLRISEAIAHASNESGSNKSSLNDLLLELADAYFDFDQHDLGAEARAALSSDVSVLDSTVNSPETTLLIEGHCDERGSAEYNLALGAMRAEAAKEFLVQAGIPVAMLKTITYGKERPQCTAQTEECWQKNRRAHLKTE
jgi:peptidoglycan-associated lipoprotein